MNNRDVLFLGALILVGAVMVELYSNFSNPFIDYAPGAYTSLLSDMPQQFDYYKDGEHIGTYTYTLTSETINSKTLYTLYTIVNASYQGNILLVNTTHRFQGETSHVKYSVDSTIAAIRSHLECVFLGGNVRIISSSQGKNQTLTVELPSNTVLIDNSDPAHWELLMKSFTAEAGKRYHINTLVPQGGAVQQIEFGVDTSHQFVNIGSKSYECVIAREPNYEITLYFYQGNLIQYRNDVDGVLIVKKMN